MKPSIFILVALLMVGGCSKNRIPDPYAGFEHASAEQGYWKEVTSDKETIGELHFHSKGFSLTYNPFESYKDYWGDYTINEKRGEIRLNVETGNRLPGFSKATGSFQRVGGDEIEISGIGLDSRRSTKERFRFERFHPNQ